MDFWSRVKWLLFGDNADDATVYYMIYGVAGLLFVVVGGVIIGLGGSGAILPVVFVGIAGAAVLILITRIVAILLLGSGSMFSGRPDADDEATLSEIEQYEGAGRYAEAAEFYMSAYELSDHDLTPLVRAGQLYWVRLREYEKALECFREVATRTADAECRVDMVGRMMEIYRSHLPDSPEFTELSRWVLQHMPRSVAAKIAREHLSKGK